MSSWAVYSLLHFPSRHRDSTLWSVLPCGVRTFLPAFIHPATVCSGQTEIILQSKVSAFHIIKNPAALGAEYQLISTLNFNIQLGRDIHKTP